MRDFEERRLGLKLGARIVGRDPISESHGLMKIVCQMGEPQTYVPWVAIEEWFDAESIRTIRNRGGLTSQEMDQTFPRWRDFATRELERIPLYNPLTARS